MKILIDENILYARELFGQLGEVRTISGRQISRKELNDTDALIVSSVTKVSKDLLENTPIKFVGTATAGTDHINTAWLRQSNIGFSSAPGCNAIAVVEYIFSTLFTLSERDGFSLKERVVGIIGAGNIGKRLKTRLDELGVRTLLCDPPRADLNKDEDFYPLEELIEQVDVITFHTPLLKEGLYKTFHLANKTLIDRLKTDSILINTSRGSVVDNAALLKSLERRRDLSVILDVWEGEPDLNIDLLKKVNIGTAHIAGHTLEGKIRGTTQIFEAYSTFIGRAEQMSLDELLPTPKFSCITLHGKFDETVLKHLAHLVYDARRDDASLRRMIWIPNGFDMLRKNYLGRREWSSLRVICDCVDTAVRLRKLGFDAVYYTPIC